eukprot:CAMPEP_0178967158 /NCGR_PEP_ID=MMETSP0789-20121207/17404_1 /TAXON_ID=3005 /ORGANISM="Rhizosolenia setigera, Strain CCMP 1694" /LENGTH=76 /DNA_ID=CAMNT_0020652667 /DNA_START=209 /DNA_END=440 /DNA_ORIENTATION=+
MTKKTQEHLLKLLKRIEFCCFYYHQSDAANDAVVVCCGSAPLVESVTEEVQKLNKTMKKENTTSMGTLDLIVLNPN